MTQDLSLIARQLRRETQAAEEAAHRLTKATKEAEDRTYASNTVYGRHAVKHLLEPVSKRITERLFTLRRGSGAVDATEVFKHLKDADANTLALITMKTVLDVLGKDPEPSLTDLSTKVGKNVQLELRMSYYAIQEPELYKKTEFFFHKGTGFKQKATVFTRAFNKQAIDWDRWSNTVNHKVGAWLITCLIESTGWLERRFKQVHGTRRKAVIGYTRDFIAQRDTILAAAESMAFCQWPMLCPPVDWTNNSSGGYLTESVRQANPLIRKAGSLGPFKQGDIPLAMLNNLQQQAYKVNPLILGVAEHFYENRISVGKFVQQAPMPLPANTLTDTAPEEEVTAYKRSRRIAEDFNSVLSQKNWRTTEVMYVAGKYADEERFYCPASFDYRGRVYFQNTALNPQGTDFDKALLYFADEGPVNEYYLAFHVATTFGHDKETMEFRVNWARENTSLISRVAQDPIGNHEWRTADEPWCFLAACIEYYECVITATKPTSGLPVGIDATCSGLQHLSAMTLCGDTAALVNVTPTPKPADAYKTVAEAAKKHIDSKYHGWMNRKVTKRPVMCTPYGVTGSSARGYIRDELIKAGHKEEIREAGVLSDIVRGIFNHAIPEVLPGPIQVMKWLKSSATAILESGKETITWTTPSGFVVNQDLRVSNQVEVKTRLMGGVRIKCMVGDGYLGPDRPHHRSALAPNVVHSLDSSLLHLSFAFYEQPFTLIHDCVLGRSCDMEEMGSLIRLHFAEMYKAPVMQDWADQVGVGMPDDLIKNTLDIESVNQSPYFFC